MQKLRCRTLYINFRGANFWRNLLEKLPKVMLDVRVSREIYMDDDLTKLALSVLTISVFQTPHNSRTPSYNIYSVFPRFILNEKKREKFNFFNLFPNDILRKKKRKET